ncbi:unnamed protein product [Closterium sp. Naga37s-1]|nr:unnamed protein product [Closterium sp. Naga37s-1]
MSSLTPTSHPHAHPHVSPLPLSYIDTNWFTGTLPSTIGDLPMLQNPPSLPHTLFLLTFPPHCPSLSVPHHPPTSYIDTNWGRSVSCLLAKGPALPSPTCYLQFSPVPCLLPPPCLTPRTPAAAFAAAPAPHHSCRFINQNSLSGPLPATITSLTNLRILSVSLLLSPALALLSPLPVLSFLVMPSFMSSNPYLDGPLPADLGNMSYFPPPTHLLPLLSLSPLSSASLLPSSPHCLPALMDNCRFTGSIPQGISNLKALTVL